MIRLDPEHLDNLITDSSDKHLSSYYVWIRHIITLSAGALALLVGFQKSYVSDNSGFIWILKLSWGLFFISILLGIIASYGESRAHFDVGDFYMKLRKSGAKYISQSLIILPPKLTIKWAQRLLPFTFAAAFLCLIIFAMAGI